MGALTHEQFVDFFRGVHGYEPFDWQKRLAKEVLQGGGWHDVIRVPTACGKTSVLDLAVFELAMQADSEPNQRTAARRICFVIDRRLVVDEATERARRIRDAIQAAASSKCNEPVLRAVAERLASLAADAAEPLRVVRLRGGVYRDDGWAADPLTPTILVSTVDQIGSRLLFRGYGLSSRSRPSHAGLLAFDTRIILDEAHLSTVFAGTLNRIRQYQKWPERLPLAHGHTLSVVCMSATAREGERIFELRDEERQDARLKPRLDAHKPAELVEVKVEPISKEMRQKQRNKAQIQEKKNRQEVVEKLVEEAKRLAGFTGDVVSNPPRVIGVVVNRVATARGVFERLRTGKDREPERDVILLTGRVRPHDRDRLLDDWLPRIKAGREAEPERTLFVVATQTVEVGANLDFGALVTEAAALDALRQRFGRLDRLGSRNERGEVSPAAIVIRSDQKSKSQDDPLYGSAIAETWAWLSQKGVRDKQKRVDFGVNHLDPKLKKAAGLTPMLTPRPDVPLLFPAHLDTWVQTDPLPEPDPDVAPFLHGPAATADVQVVWRADLDGHDDRLWRDTVTLMPPRTRESLPVPVYEVRNWLRNQAAADVADIEGATTEGATIRAPRNQHRPERRALRWRGPDDPQTKPVGPDDVRPGDTIVVPASCGGADRFGWNPAYRDPVEDVAEACLAHLIASYPHNAFRRPVFHLRLHPSLLPGCDPAARSRLLALLDGAAAATKIEDRDPWPPAARLLEAVKPLTTDRLTAAAITALLAEDARVALYPDGRGVVISAEVGIKEKALLPLDEIEHEEPQEDEASAARRPVPLSKHSAAVRKKVVAFAKACGLDVNDTLTTALRLAAQWHDEGKRDSRFQAWLYGSELKALAALAVDQPLAKSGLNPKRWRSSEAFGYPRGSRHEFVSVRLFEKASEAGDEAGELAKLLIGTHHGCGRAFPRVLKDSNPVTVTLQRNGSRFEVSSDHRLYRLESGWVDLFWKMVRRYGWWGLAYLEALVVAADRLVSADEQRQIEKQAGETGA